MKKHFEITDEFVDKIISTAYGDGSLFDKIDVYLKAFSNQQVRRILNDYKAVAKSVKNISGEFAPVEVVKSVQKDLNIHDNFFDSFFSGLYKLIILKPAYSAAVLVIIMSVSVFIFLRHPEQKPAYSKVQITQAEKQVRESFDLVGRILARVQIKVTNQVLNNDVARPIQKGTSVINNLFNGG